MQRRLRIIMDPDHVIQPDAKTNWVTSTDNLEWDVMQAQKENRDTLVIQS